MTIRVGPSRPVKIIAESAKSIKSRSDLRRIDKRLDRLIRACIVGIRCQKRTEAYDSIQQPLFRWFRSAPRRSLANSDTGWGLLNGVISVNFE